MSASEASSDGAFKSFALLVAWGTVAGMVMGGVGAIISDVADWDLAMGVGGSRIDIPQDRYVGVSLLVLAGFFVVVLRFGGGAIDFLKAHKIPSAIAGAVGVAALALGGGRLVEALDGGPAVVAAMDGDTERLEALFEAGDVAEEDHGQMLCWAAQKGHVDTLHLLLAEGISPNTPRGDGASALSLACSYGGKDAVDVLKSAGADGECAMPPA